jgi:hypothetical protein
MTRTDNEPAARAEFQAVLGSGLFHAGSNSDKLLRYVCTRYFDGDSSITEAEIAVHALGRRADFDPKEDAIVRVEAHRVRKRLAEYYSGVGEFHGVRLELPPGGYVPLFKDHAGNGQAPVPVPASASTRIPQRTKWWLIAAVVALVTTGLLLRIVQFHVAPAAALAAKQTVLSSELPPEVRIMAGSSARDYTDRLGHVWSADRLFEGGEAWSAKFRRISRTDDVQLYLTSRQGKDFTYHIPLRPGLYEVRLHFAETFYGEDNPEGGGESSRIFDVSANGAPLLTAFDPLSDAGGTNTADVRVFTGLSPASDGALHLRFWNKWTLKAAASVNGIEVIPTLDKGMAPIRWIPSEASRVDSAGHLWQPDQFVQGGRRREYREDVIGAVDPALYHSDRYGHMTYAIPVPSGSYRLTLHFSEHWFGVPDYATGSGPGSRVFDVYCNGVTLLRDFDIFKEAGGCLRPIVKVFHGLKPNHQGKLILYFVPSADYACVNALEVVDESMSRSNSPSRTARLLSLLSPTRELP